MRLAQRLLVYTLIVVGCLVAFVLVAVRERTGEGLRAETGRRVRAEAALAARAWQPAEVAPARLADSLAAVLGRHVTLVDPAGRVVGDSETRDLGQGWLTRYATLPEVARARRDAPGAPHGAAQGATSSAVGVPEVAGAARGPAGIVRVAAARDAGHALVNEVQRGVLLAGLAALVIAAGGAVLFGRTVSRPLAELRDVARALASGDLSRRPALTAPGEVGDLATAVHRLAEQLGARLDALRGEEALMVALTESLSEGVVALDARQRVVRVNAMARRLLRLRDEVPFPADHLPRERVLREALADALAGRATEDAAELRVDDRVLMLTARPLAGGGAVLAFYDLTPLRRLETVRRDFVANVSHELRTPLTVIGGFAETLADEELPPAQRRQFAATIQANARRMQRIVDDLLDLSRIESGGWRPAPAPVDVAQAADEAVAAARDAATAKGIVLRVAPSDDARVVVADPTAVRQVLSNLTENAVRHTASGTVSVFTRRAAQGGVWLGVRDTGSGIGAEHLPRIFERFYRADPGRSREAGGTGLGLAIVKHLAEAHGGEVRAESRLGHGTTIEVRFPEPAVVAGGALPTRVAAVGA
ncbi:MAG TPA: ATP-binding protein [Gemmatirosa sp.]|nr:ATP-binding protein [Gemmatirosa sp.]